MMSNYIGIFYLITVMEYYHIMTNTRAMIRNELQCTYIRVIYFVIQS